MFDALHGIADGMSAYVASEIHEAAGDSSHHHDHYHPMDMDDFHVFSPWDDHGDLAHHSEDHHTTSVGHPDGDGFTHQTTAFTCALVSQKMILDRFHIIDPRTGDPVSEAQLVYDATVHGWIDDHGTSLADMGMLLDHYGISSHHGSSWSDLIHELADGHQVVLAVNADELWSDHGFFGPVMQLFGNHPNHALVLKGLKLDENGHVTVVVNDPGQHDGAGVEYALEDFQLALNARDFHYVATDAAPPDWTPDAATEALTSNHAAATSDHETRAESTYAVDGFAKYLAAMDEEQKHRFMLSL